MWGLATVWVISVGVMGAEHEFTAGEEIGGGAHSEVIQTLAGNPLSSWGNTDSESGNLNIPTV